MLLSNEKDLSVSPEVGEMVSLRSSEWISLVKDFQQLVDDKI